MPDHDVAIVGGGPVGLLLACLLVQDGVNVAVFDRRGTHQGSGSTRAIGIHPPGLTALYEAGIGSALERQAMSITGGSALCRGSVLAELELARKGNARGVFTLQQQTTEALLRARLAELAPEALQSGVTVRTVSQVSASIVVAADGVRSGIRDELCIGWRKIKGEGHYAMADLPESEQLSDHQPGRVRLFCEPDGIVESFPLPGGYRRWVVGTSKNITEMTHEHFASIIEQRTGIILPSIRGATQVSTFFASQHLAESLSWGSTVLVGDAAHEVSPIGGQGMNLGWIGAMKLRSSILAALRTGIPDFKEYERDTLRAASIAQRRARFNMRAGQPARGASLLMRNLMIRGIGVTPLKNVMARAFTMQGIE